MSTKVCTIGYQGKQIEAFVQELVTAGVEVLVDVRRRALSRKPGFSKTKLSMALSASGIGYLHYPELGMLTEHMPKRNLTDNSEILELYRKQLKSHERSLRAVSHAAASGNICLLCFESDHTLCHRSVLANWLQDQVDLDVLHI